MTDTESATLDSDDRFLLHEEGGGELTFLRQARLKSFQIELFAEQITNEALELASDVGIVGDMGGEFRGHVDQIVHGEEGGSEASTLLIDGVEGAKAVVGLRVSHGFLDATDEAEGEVRRVRHGQAQELGELADRCRRLTCLLDAVAKVGVTVFVVKAVLEATDGSDRIVTVPDSDGVTEGRGHGHHAVGADLTKHGEEALGAAVAVEGDLQGEAGKEGVVVDDEAFSAEGLEHGVDDSVTVGDRGTADDLFTEMIEVHDGFVTIGEADGATSLHFIVHVDHLGAVDLAELGEDLFGGEETEDAVGLTDQTEHRIAEAASAGEIRAVCRNGGWLVAGGRSVGDGVNRDVDGLDGGDEGGIRGDCGFHGVDCV